MTEPAFNTTLPQSRGSALLQNIILALCLSVIALRTMVTESPGIVSTHLPVNLGDEVYSLSVSAVLILSFVIWFVSSFCSRKFYYRLTTLEPGLGIFIIAAVLAGLAAANKRSAVNGFVTLLAPVLMAVMLVQILDSQSKVKLVLTVIAALGVVSAYQCAEQFFFTNQMMIEQYRQNPAALLAPLGIEAGTFEHMLFEHRLYSRGIHGFFTTSNSAGSFALLASFAAAALFIDGLRNRKSDASAPARLFAAGFATTAVIFGLAITASKGAIIASLIAAVMFAAYLSFGSWLRIHKKAIVILCLAALLAGGLAVVLYGLSNDRLPGGNSMLVRWQYWKGSAGMYADHPVTGVGPGNFVYFYPRHKAASAPETIADPHNFLLSILTQYGPLGLLGFLTIILVPLYKAVFHPPANPLQSAELTKTALWTPVLILLAVISAALLFIRPLFLKMPPDTLPGEREAATVMLFIVPVIVFVFGFLLFMAGRIEAKSAPNILVAALVCAIVGFLIHNLIDFAIFEPGVLTAFLAVLACLIASAGRRRTHVRFIQKAALAKVTMALAGVVLIWAFLNFALLPAVKRTAKIRQAYRSIASDQFEKAHSLLTAAAEADYSSPTGPSINGRLFIHQFRRAGADNPELLFRAEKSLLEAVRRNNADFKNFEHLTEVYTLLAETSSPLQRSDYLNNAFEGISRAAALYPGSGRLHFKMAQIAEKLAKPRLAKKQYQKAVEIEDGFREQFQRMYPGRQIVSRLGNEKYNSAKQRIKALKKYQQKE